eukprot:1185226-Amorphochlora_amoeboformis.AAC.2
MVVLARKHPISGGGFQRKEAVHCKMRLQPSSTTLLLAVPPHPSTDQPIRYLSFRMQTTRRPPDSRKWPFIGMAQTRLSSIHGLTFNFFQSPRRSYQGLIIKA